ncbi:MAG: hypothetical protein LBL69_05565 [Zoogloeaceae bacterium]|jgi:hypothetical protein|nr:hypothetical protein [Zoogloeaceae bacterium]
MSLFQKLSRLFQPEEAVMKRADLEAAWLEHTLELTDLRLSQVKGFRDFLLPAVSRTLSYFTRTFAQVPGPVSLEKRTPQLEALFPGGKADKRAALGRSLAVKQEFPALAAAGHERLVALMGMRLRRQGNATQLADHTIRSLAVSSEAVRAQLMTAAYDSLLQAFDNAQRRAEDPDARAPADYLDDLLAWLKKPESCVRMAEDQSHTITGHGGAPDLCLPLMHSQDRREWLLTLVDFPTQMAEDALKAEEYTHRFILI